MTSSSFWADGNNGPCQLVPMDAGGALHCVHRSRHALSTQGSTKPERNLQQHQKAQKLVNALRFRSRNSLFLHPAPPTTDQQTSATRIAQAHTLKSQACGTANTRVLLRFVQWTLIRVALLNAASPPRNSLQQTQVRDSHHGSIRRL